MIDESRLFLVSHSCLRVLAALVWYGGSIVLLFKGISLLLEADALEPEEVWPWLAAFTGLILGGFKAKFLFNRSCQKNLDRIDTLCNPRVWQFFKPGFFIFLTSMILVGATLSTLAHNNYPMLISVSTLDLSIAAALLRSSRIFWKHEIMVK